MKLPVSRFQFRVSGPFQESKKNLNLNQHAVIEKMSSSEEDVEELSESEDEEEEEVEDEEKVEEETKQERDTKRDKPTIVERPLEYGLKRIDRISRWIDFLRNRMGSIYNAQNLSPKVIESAIPSETKMSTNVPALSEDKRFQEALDKLLG